MPDITIGRYQTQDIVKLDTYGPGTVTKSMEIRGNAILSTIFVKSADVGASVKVNYFQTTSGTIDDPERHDLDGHPPKDASDALITSQIVVTRVHNKPVLEFIVTGGNVEFGIYVTVTDELASDIDSALVLDEEVADLLVNKGIPTACYDPSTGKWRLIRCNPDGSLTFTLSPGDGVYREGSETTNAAGNPHSFDSFAVPVGKIYRIEQVVISTFVDGVFTLTAGGATIGKGRTGPTSINSSFKFKPIRSVAAGITIALSFNQLYQTPSGCTVDWHIHMSEVDA